MTDVPVGSHWRNTKRGYETEIVDVFRATTNNVFYRGGRDGRKHCMPTTMFAATYQRVDGQPAKRCERCTTRNVKPGRQYCSDCVGLIMASNRARQKRAEDQNGPVIVTRAAAGPVEEPMKSNGLSPTPVVPQAAAAQSEPLLRWRVRGKRVIVEERTLEVDAQDMVGALAVFEHEYPGVKATAAEMLDG